MFNTVVTGHQQAVTHSDQHPRVLIDKPVQLDAAADWVDAQDDVVVVPFARKAHDKQAPYAAVSDQTLKIDNVQLCGDNERNGSDVMKD